MHQQHHGRGGALNANYILKTVKISTRVVFRDYTECFIYKLHDAAYLTTLCASASLAI